MKKYYTNKIIINIISWQENQFYIFLTNIWHWPKGDIHLYYITNYWTDLSNLCRNPTTWLNPLDDNLDILSHRKLSQPSSTMLNLYFCVLIVIMAIFYGTTLLPSLHPLLLNIHDAIFLFCPLCLLFIFFMAVSRSCLSYFVQCLFCLSFKYIQICFNDLLIFSDNFINY